MGNSNYEFSVISLFSYMFRPKFYSFKNKTTLLYMTRCLHHFYLQLLFFQAWIEELSHLNLQPPITPHSRTLQFSQAIIFHVQIQTNVFAVATSSTNTNWNHCGMVVKPTCIHHLEHKKHCIMSLWWQTNRAYLPTDVKPAHSTKHSNHFEPANTTIAQCPKFLSKLCFLFS